MNDATMMGYKACAAATIRLMKSGMPAVLVLGRPGIGKTAMERLVADGVGLKHVFRTKLSHHDVPDVAGVPVPSRETMMTHFFPSADMLPKSDLKGGCLMVLDEIGDCNVSQQNLACQMVFEGKIHNYTFPENTYFLLTSNRVADRSGANRIVTKLGNRVAILTLDPAPDELFDYGAHNGWNPTLLAFIKMHGGERINPNSPAAGTYFNSFDPTDPAQMAVPTFASSRSYEFVSNYLNYVDANEPGLEPGIVLQEVASLLGTVVAAKFVAFRDVAKTMPDPDAILRGEKVPQPDKTGVLWALTLTLASKVTKKTLENMVDYLDQGPVEYLGLAVRILFDTKQAELAGPGFSKLVRNPKLSHIFARK